MTDGRLIGIEARARLATPTLKTYCASGRWVLAGIGHIQAEVDARFFDGAREDVLWLIAAVRERDTEIARLKSEHDRRVTELLAANNAEVERRRDAELAARKVLARPKEDWHEDFGDVLWWKFPVEESPYVGNPLCSDWPGYHTHWTPLPPVPLDPDREVDNHRQQQSPFLCSICRNKTRLTPCPSCNPAR